MCGPPTRPILTGLSTEPDFVHGDVQSGCSPYDHFEVVVVDFYAVEKLVEEHAALLFARSVPDGFYVDVG